MIKTKYIAFLSIMAAAAMVLSVVESFFPTFVPIPGIKIGLANIVTLLVLKIHRRFSFAALIAILRCALAAAYSGTVTALLYSLAGGLLSCLAMWLLLRPRKGVFGTVGVSIVGGVTHNTAQILVAMAIMRDFAVIYYLPVLLASGLIAGAAIGVAADRLFRLLPKSLTGLA
ncbi:MAG: Gx transporter family protein [Clostridiales bacterium]|jgi:heptaprenyl diphosphate synthase|nr:Gx transporter family protein [Clostridiales bacterium]